MIALSKKQSRKCAIEIDKHYLSIQKTGELNPPKDWINIIKVGLLILRLISFFSSKEFRDKIGRILEIIREETKPQKDDFGGAF